MSEVVKSMFRDIGTIKATDNSTPVDAQVWVGKQLIGGMVCRIDLNKGDGGIRSTKLDRGGRISKVQRSNLSKRDKGLSRQPKS
jgi:hypothetical protein